MKKFTKINESFKDQLDDYCIEITDALGINPIITDRKTPRYEIFDFIWDLKINVTSITENSKDFQNYLNALQQIPAIYSRVKVKSIQVKLLPTKIQITFKKSINPDKKTFDFISHVEDFQIFLDYSEIESWFKQNGYKITNYELPEEDEGFYIHFDSTLPGEDFKKFVDELKEECDEKINSGIIDTHIRVNRYSRNTVYFYPTDRITMLSIID